MRTLLSCDIMTRTFHISTYNPSTAFSTTCSLIPKNSANFSKLAFSFSVVIYAYTSFAP